MGWEQRKGHKYYYYKKRVNGRVTSVYAGRGEVAEQAASLVEGTGQIMRLLKALERQETAALDQFDREVDAVCEIIQLVTRQALLETGHHQHKGQWRKRQHGKS